MKLSRHFIISLFMGTAVWFFVKSLYAGLVCFFSGVFVDIDHVIEYIIHYGWRNFTFKKFFLACEQTDRQEGEYQFRKLYLIFHSGEFALALWFLSIYIKNVYLFAGALGYSTHLILDYIGNDMYLLSYFLVWRAINKFHTDRILRKAIQKK